MHPTSKNIIKAFFEAKSLASIQIDSFNSFITNGLPSIINGKYVLYENDTCSLYIIFNNTYMNRPYYIDDQRVKRILYPNEARIKDINYETTVLCDIETLLLDKEDSKVLYHNIIYKYELFKLPIMLRSNLCNLIYSSHHHSEDPNDCGGYFIIKGKERVIASQETINYNQVYIYELNLKKYRYIAEIRSVKEDADYSIMVQIKLTNEDELLINFTQIGKVDIPLTAIFGIFERNLLDYIRLTKSELKLQDIQNILNLIKIESKSKDECLKLIGSNITNVIEESKKANHVENIVKNEILPHLGSYCDDERKCVFLGIMVTKLLRTFINKRKLDDRDHIGNKRIDTVENLMYFLINTLFKQCMKSIYQHIETKEKSTDLRNTDDFNVLNVITKFNITHRFSYCLTTGNWGVHKSKYIRQGVSQIFSRLSYIGTISHLRRLIVPIGKESRNIQIRQLHSTSYGFLCPVETPEGEKCGIVKNFAILTTISSSIPFVYIYGILYSILGKYIKIRGITSIFINGIYVCGIDIHPLKCVEVLKEYREFKIIPRSVSIIYDPVDGEIHLYSDGGRIMRLVINAKKENVLSRINDIINNCRMAGGIANALYKLLEESLLVFIDGMEAESSYICMYIEDLNNKTAKYDYCEVHPSAMFGICGNMIPSPNHSQGPRNIYATSMMKQAIGYYSNSYTERFDTISAILNYPQKRLCPTVYTEILKCEEMPSGVNCIVAVMCYTGFNQEDSVIVNKSAIERGLFNCTIFKTICTYENKKNTYELEVITVPSEKIKNKNLNYSKLDENGIVKLSSHVKKNDVLIGKVFYNNDEEINDCSVICKSSEAGIIDKIQITTNSSGYKMVKLRIRQERIPEIGDKLAALSAQKGTIGMVYRQEDMPFSQNGIVPDIILNPHAIPSRMTLNMYLEILCSKSACFTGELQDLTAFCHDGIELIDKVSQHLVDSGYQRYGYEKLCNGFTGEMLDAQIYMGVAYYQRLKHLVGDKLHARNYGNVQQLSRQPCAGRAKDGGLRFGEMERDCMISHGSANFLRERLYNLSDPYDIYVCDDCGAMVNNKNECMMCKSDKCSKIKMAYACKLLFQELQALGISIKVFS